MKKIYFLVLCFLTFGVLSAQEKLSKEEQARREKNIQAGNPFAKFGYKGKVATLSKGKYLEVHDLDSIVTIGSIRYHVDKKQIVGNIVIDTTDMYARPIGDTPSRWLSPDPLSEEFPNWTPYRYGFNNPLRYTDPTGLLEDDFGVDSKGNISLIRETDEKVDRLFAVDDAGAKKDVNTNGNVDNSDSVEVKKGVLNNIKADTDSNGIGYSFMKSDNSTQSSNLFEFLAVNTNVEWGKVDVDNKSFISTEHNSTREAGSADILYKNLLNGTGKSITHSHSHPAISFPGYVGPSGFNKKSVTYGQGDDALARWTEQYYKSKNVKFKVYETTTNQYIPYNNKGIIKK
jgi:hypothetical protein